MMKEYMTLHMIALAAGIILDLAIGDPHGIPHPVRAIGAYISALERGLLPDKELSGKSLIRRGAVLWFAVVLTTGAIAAGIIILAAMTGKILFAAAEAVLTYYCLAARQLGRESMKVYYCLTGDAGSCVGNIGDARASLSMIVGRDTAELDETGIARAAVETVAENTSDGVIAPLIYTAVGGPVLGLMYKAVNTMDSMIGYKNARYEYFGRFAARSDDAANYIPSRISAIIMIAAAGLLELIGKAGNKPNYDMKRSYEVWRRDRMAHSSPNSAQCESACAGALGVRLGGTSSYGGVPVSKPYIGDGYREPEIADIGRSVKLMYATEAVCTAVIYIITLSILIFRLT